jgi:hypothetical protein
MTLHAAKLLDDAFEVYLKIASTPDSGHQQISWQTPSWEAPRTPYDFAALLCKSLIPRAYNYPVEDYARTERIWDLTIDAMEVLPIDTALSLSSSR